jgi:hypothetical protein
MLLEWLQEIVRADEQERQTPADMKLEIMWKHSLYSMKHNEPLVDSLDPDCRSRKPESRLEDSDELHDENLMADIWNCIRAGELHEPKRIQELCEQYGQPWRAASLLGGTVYGGANKVEDPGGNASRNLWKDMCWKIAESQAGRGDAADYERAVYAALAGNQKVLEQFSHCRSWEDQCWLRLYLAVESFKDKAIDTHHKQQYRRSKCRAGRADGLAQNKAQEIARTQSAAEVTCESVLHAVESSKYKAADQHHRYNVFICHFATCSRTNCYVVQGAIMAHALAHS